MNRWITVNAAAGVFYSAAFKPRTDIKDFAARLGYRPIWIPSLGHNKQQDRNQVAQMVSRLIEDVGPGDLAVLQYTTYNGWWFDNVLIDQLRERGARLFAIVQDVETLRFGAHLEQLEVSTLNKCEVVISHNDVMSAELRKMGVQAALVPIQLFDYKYEGTLPSREFQRRVIFAGLLDKSAYLRDWSYDVPVVAFGRRPDWPVAAAIDLRSPVDPDELPGHLPSGFGLVWDQDNRAGTYGQYMRYNNPHKASLYLSSGLPLIVWSESPLAKWVRDHDLGLVLDSLDDLPAAMNAVDEDRFKTMQANAARLAELLRAGHFTQKALRAAEAELFKLQDEH